MSTGTIFFSYSREDSEFVLDLAKTLRDAGATIWLDQLDIQPGTRWDRSIETALTSSNTLLVILSKSSVASQNVLDEVSFALEENKKVVPVLLEDCDIPFRLRRLQFADFREDRDHGINTLITSLDLDREVASKLVEEKTDGHTPSSATAAASSSQREVSQAAGTSTPPPTSRTTPLRQTRHQGPTKTTTPETETSGKKKYMMPLIIGGAVVVLAIAFFAWSSISDKRKAEEEKARLAEEARIEEENIAKAAKAADSVDWNTLLRLEDLTVEQLEAHKSEYAPCPHTVEADSLITEILYPPQPAIDSTAVVTNAEEEALREQEKLDWRVAEQIDTDTGYINYLMQYGKDAANSENALNLLEARMSAEGWTQYGDRRRSGDEKLSKHYYKVVYPISEAYTTSDIPKVGDYIVTVRDGSVIRNRIPSSANSRRLGGSKTGHLLKVEALEDWGTALWVKVSHNSEAKLFDKI